MQIDPPPRSNHAPEPGLAHPSGFDFAALCSSRAALLVDGGLLVCEAVDELQAVAEYSGLIDAIGQDAVQDIMGEAIAAASLVPELAEPDLADEIEAEIMLRAADLVRQWELADPRDRRKHTGEPKPIERPVVRQREPYAPPQSTVDAFLYVAARDDVAHLKAWLDDHRKDAPILLKLLEAKLCS
jgi:hypothetical protein